MPTFAGKSSLLFVLYGCICAGCGSGHPSGLDDFSYNPPEGLQQQDQQVRGNTVFVGPVENGFKANLQVKSGNSSQAAEQIGKDDLSKLSGKPGVTVIEQEPFTFPDSDAYTWKVSKKSTSGVVADQRQFIVLKNNIYILFTLTASDSTMGKWDQALADSIQQGFHWGR